MDTHTHTHLRKRLCMLSILTLPNVHPNSLRWRFPDMSAKRSSKREQSDWMRVHLKEMEMEKGTQMDIGERPAGQRRTYGPSLSFPPHAHSRTRRALADTLGRARHAHSAATSVAST